ncbi:hypothetical protein Y887_04890 [Xanthomonas pisi DSM 18956]|nr:hypothetical protein Y887_04890 [Xanthomonas pisi DSM 18956]
MSGRHLTVIEMQSENLRATNKTTALSARRARPVLGAACPTRTLRFLRVADAHLTTARYVL